MDSNTPSNSVKYHWALNDKGETVSIKDINEQNRGEKYFCPNCGGSMIPSSISKENKRQPHFKHKGDEHCSYESYLHKLAKKRLKEFFDRRTNFFVEVDAINCCENFTTCKLKRTTDANNINTRRKFVDCKSHYKKTLDLKKLYDRADLEGDYNKFKADVMLSDSKGEYPVPLFLEICKTHECEPEKIDSGIPIIEFVVKTEEDLVLLENNVIRELSVQVNNRKKLSEKIVFHNLNGFEDAKPYEDNLSEYKVDATVYIIEQGKIIEKQDTVNCHDLYTGEQLPPDVVSALRITNPRLANDRLELDYTKRCWFAQNNISRRCCEQCKNCNRQIYGNGWNRRASVSCMKDVSVPIKSRTWSGQIVESLEPLSRYCQQYGYDKIFSLSCPLFEFDEERMKSVIERGGCVGWARDCFEEQG